jgi:hypothetical protein
VVLPPARFQFRAVHLLTRRTGVSRGHNGVILIDNDRAEIAPQAGALVGAPERKVKEVVVPVGPHLHNYGKARY